jgi:hypothetical protein
MRNDCVGGHPLLCLALSLIPFSLSLYGIITGTAGDPPPQAVSIPATANVIASSSIIHTLRRLPSQRKPTASASGAAGKSGREFHRSDPAAVLAERVSWVVTAPVPEGVTVAGLNVQLTPGCKPVQAKLTVESNPFCGVTVSVTMPWLPEAIVSEVGEPAKPIFFMAFSRHRNQPPSFWKPNHRRPSTTLSPYLLRVHFPRTSGSPRLFSRAGWRPWELMTQPDTNRVSDEKQRGASKDKAVENPCGRIGRVAKVPRSEEVLEAALAMRRRKENALIRFVGESQKNG